MQWKRGWIEIEMKNAELGEILFHLHHAGTLTKIRLSL